MKLQALCFRRASGESPCNRHDLVNALTIGVLARPYDQRGKSN
jgi:hypothetical protein